MITQEFNKVTTTSNFIKNLLISTYLPLIRTVRDFDYIIEDRLYIYRCNVIKCTKSGYIVTGYQYFNFNGERASFVIQSEYYFGERNDKLCTNYISNTEGYDSVTHERLGKYLRSLRDMYDLNLMPLYNCFSNQIFQAHHISDERVEKTATEYNTKIYKVPIRFNTDYTICMSNPGITTFAPAFIKNSNLMRVNNTRFGNDADVTNKYIKLHHTNVVTNRTALRFNAPFKLRFNNIPETKEIHYVEYRKVPIDTLHDDSLYHQATSESYPREIYYIQITGTYDYVQLTLEEYNKNPLQYYYNKNGTLVQCTPEDSYDPTRIYYQLVSVDGVTYLPTTLSPSETDTPLYIGVEPGTGRSDSAYISDRRGLWWVDNVMYQDIAELENEDDVLKVEIHDDVVVLFKLDGSVLSVDMRRDQIFESPSYETVVLWRHCTDYDEFDSKEIYYLTSQGQFYKWDYKQPEEGQTVGQEQLDYEADPSSFYYKDGDDYIQCKLTDEYDIEKEYYVYYLGQFVRADAYYFSMHQTRFYIGTGWKPGTSPEDYYKLVNGKIVPCASDEEFDINTTYLMKVDMEITPWQDEEGNDSTDKFIEEGKTYYSSEQTAIEGSYKYDITSENCALYDYCEDNLYLLIQVPKEFDSNIVILEGDYLNTKAIKHIDDNSVDMLPRPIVDYLYTSNLKLMQMSSKTIIPFSDALIEFLLWNAINNLDSINNNLDRLLIAMDKIVIFNTDVHFPNYWYPQYRKLIYDVVNLERRMPVTDNLGYVTRNVEQIIDTIPNSYARINDTEPTALEEG